MKKNKKNPAQRRKIGTLWITPGGDIIRLVGWSALKIQDWEQLSKLN